MSLINCRHAAGSTSRSLPRSGIRPAPGCPATGSILAQKAADLHGGFQMPLFTRFETNLALNTGLSRCLRQYFWNSYNHLKCYSSLFAQIHPCHLQRITNVFSFSYKLETDFQNSLFMHLNEMTEVLGPFDQRQSLRCWEPEETSFLMKHIFRPFIMSFTQLHFGQSLKFLRSWGGNTWGCDF